MSKKGIKISFLESSLGNLKENRKPKPHYKQPRNNWKNILLIDNVYFGTIIYKNVNKEITSQNKCTHWDGIKKYEENPLLSKNLKMTKSTVGNNLKFHLPDGINQKIDKNLIDAKEKNPSTFYLTSKTTVAIEFEKQGLKKSKNKPNTIFHINWVCEKVKHLSNSKTQANPMLLCS